MRADMTLQKAPCHLWPRNAGVTSCVCWPQGQVQLLVQGLDSHCSELTALCSKRAQVKQACAFGIALSVS